MNLPEKNLDTPFNITRTSHVVLTVKDLEASRLFYTEVVGPFWPGNRVLVDQGYRTVEFPSPELAPPRFEMTEEWTLDHVVGYLGTWSAVTRYLEAKGHDPVALIVPELKAVWGDPGRTRTVRWPLSLRVARPT